ncbi:MAG: tetratricopeptide repeat protein [Acidobacteria bacterium]|nr:tetratricopeptide repeat protein [Acidobacteriota bacterium]
MAPVTQQSWTRKEICRVLSLGERQLRSWEKQGLISETDEYAFSDLLTLRTLNTLRAQKIPVRRIRQSFRSLLDRLGQQPGDVKIFTEGKRIGVQYSGQRIEPVTGQLLFDFETANLAKTRTLAPKPEPQKNREQADFWFQKGLELEQVNAPVEEAIEAYLKAVELNPAAAGALVNLGTIYFHLREWKRSEHYYRGAIDADPNYALAHYNLGNLYDERGDSDRAYAHYHAALRLQPQYADAHYNLALLHQGQGDMMKALSHWQTYLKLDPASQWAQIARREIDKIKQSTIVPGTKPVLRP